MKYYNVMKNIKKGVIRMSKLFWRFLSAFCICSLLAGCGASEVPAQTQPMKVTEAIVETTSEPMETTVPEPETILPVPETTESVAMETAVVTEATESAEVDPAAIKQPIMELPEVSSEPCHFFDDAAIMGDSISYSLMVHHTKTKDFGDAIFLVRGSLGIHNTLNKQLTVSYQGKAMTPWDALEASGVKKVFMMMGTNDIGYYSIDETMEKWEIFLGNIREKCPDIAIYIQSLTPMWHEKEQSLLNNENIDAYNVRLQEFAEANGCHFVNIAPYFKDGRNSMAALYSGDLYVHMNEKGTAAWATVLKAYAQEQEKENP